MQKITLSPAAILICAAVFASGCGGNSSKEEKDSSTGSAKESKIAPSIVEDAAEDPMGSNGKKTKPRPALKEIDIRRVEIGQSKKGTYATISTEAAPKGAIHYTIQVIDPKTKIRQPVGVERNGNKFVKAEWLAIGGKTVKTHPIKAEDVTFQGSSMTIILPKKLTEDKFEWIAYVTTGLSDASDQAPDISQMEPESFG